jgi:hypothetical protein
VHHGSMCRWCSVLPCNHRLYIHGESTSYILIAQRLEYHITYVNIDIYTCILISYTCVYVCTGEAYVLYVRHWSQCGEDGHE